MVSRKQAGKDNKELTEADYRTITTIVLCMFFLRNSLRKLRAEDYAEKVFLKIGKSKKKPSAVRMLFDLIREDSNPVRSPDEFNQALAKEMLRRSLGGTPKDSTLKSGYQEHFQRYLDRRRMTEVLRCLRDREILKHIEGKQAIRRQMHRRPGRLGNQSLGAYNERFGGKPSADVKTGNVKSISKLLQKPRAKNIVYDALKETNILYEVERFMLSAFYFALKKRKPSVVEKNIRLVQNIMNATSSSGPIEDWQAVLIYNKTYEQISKLDDSQIKRYAARRAKGSTERRKDDMNFLPGLFSY